MKKESNPFQIWAPCAILSLARGILLQDLSMDKDGRRCFVSGSSLQNMKENVQVISILMKLLYIVDCIMRINIVRKKE